MLLSNDNPFKKIVRSVVVNMSPTLYFTQLYVRYRHRWPNFKHPKDLSEIVMSEIINGKIDEFAPYVDKVKVREYIEAWGLGKLSSKALWGLGKCGRYQLRYTSRQICVKNQSWLWWTYVLS